VGLLASRTQDDGQPQNPKITRLWWPSLFQHPDSTHLSTQGFIVGSHLNPDWFSPTSTTTTSWARRQDGLPALPCDQRKTLGPDICAIFASLFPAPPSFYAAAPQVACSASSNCNRQAKPGANHVRYSRRRFRLLVRADRVASTGREELGFSRSSRRCGEPKLVGR
jgi:hypothetical protein